LGFGIGLSLGLLGGGGSILTVPALVYLVGQAPQAAVVTSLVIVGANSLVGAVFHQHQGGGLNWKVAFLFGGTGMVAAFFCGWSFQTIFAGLAPDFFCDVDSFSRRPDVFPKRKDG
jgi:uncharacterized membrane protein YfcA